MLYRGYSYEELRISSALKSDTLDGPLGPGAYLDLIMTPQGFGRITYTAWETGLPNSVALVYLLPVESSRGFWRKLGFAPVYVDEDPDVDTEEMLWAKYVDGRELVPIEIDWEEWEDLQMEL